MSLNADLAVVSKVIKRVMGREQLKALSDMLEHTIVRDIGGEALAISTMQTETFLEDFATLAPKIMEIEGCSAIFAAATMEDKVQVVGRSNSPQIDVGEICRMLGGGGHWYAASASVKDMTLPQVRDFLQMQSSLLVNSGENAGSLMTSPAVGAPEDLSISEAVSLMNRYGLKAVPVFKKDSQVCVGLISQETAAKAAGHHLGAISIGTYMQRGFKAVPRQAGIQEIVDIMVGSQQRLIPVVDGGDVQCESEQQRYDELASRNVVGVVTRTDIIRLFMGEHGAHIPTVSRKNRKERNLASVMSKQLTPACMHFLRLAGDIAEEMGMAAYVVGGFVRDLVMERKGFKLQEMDIDLVVEGDAIEFAHQLSISVKGRVREHREFMTAMLVMPIEELKQEDKFRDSHLSEPGLFKVDIASARLEFYAEPGALPRVERASIKMDLYRRDFSINAMAIRLNPGGFGQIVDFFDGQDDIKNKRIRTLHALSFVEDPTRMFRAVRFEQRYGFRLGAQCERFMRNAIDDLHLVDQLSGGRITHELELMMEERNPYLCFKRLDELGIIGKIHPLLAMDDDKRDMADRIRRVLEWYMRMYLPEKPDMLMLMLIALCRKSAAPELAGVLNRLQFSQKRIRFTMQVRSVIMSVRQAMSKWEKSNGSLRDLHRILGRAPLESMLYLLAREDQTDQHEKLTRYIYLGREMKTDINGEDLIALGIPKGPQIGRILDEILGAKMDDPGLDKARQLEMARAYTEELNR
ncbi:MAG: CBS domain-containing protein [Mailhella sp.]|nr:CBS domain-containing protein [Mailhella sp.]